ncbi:metallophosphoesterase [Gemmobacter lutimaris]|uniref:Metallophosphoesterase n=1 Tax=Gemmobacter lutimaris TaxID=2306023 RepID=A0A398BR18_9RHOB|nr:metallophosphoesterase [Gemmobacter lutimaris]RID89773.1 metallophosphoesterase [Gemmobacter lutimaris]
MPLIAVLSDLHFDSWTRWAVDPLTATGLDIVIHKRRPDLLVIAGDLANDPVRNWPGILERLGRLINPAKIVIIPGNHCYYGHRLDGDHVLRELCSDAGARFAQKDEVRIGNTRLLCCTLWTDFLLTCDVRQAVETAGRVMNDYRRIRIGTAPGLPYDRQDTRPITPRDTLALHLDHRAWLAAALREPHFSGHEGRTVVVSHHGPSPATAVGVIDALTPSFHSNLDGLIRETQPDAWFFGHSHRRCGAHVGRTVIKNVSLGYPEELGTHALELGPLMFFETD